jgi:hypothetical protein
MMHVKAWDQHQYQQLGTRFHSYLLFFCWYTSGDLVEPTSVWSASECFMLISLRHPTTHINANPCGCSLAIFFLLIIWRFCFRWLYDKPLGRLVQFSVALLGVTGGKFLSMTSTSTHSRWQPSWIWFPSIIWRTPGTTGPIFCGLLQMTGGRFLLIGAAAHSRWQPSWIWYPSIIWWTPQSEGLCSLCDAIFHSLN